MSHRSFSHIRHCPSLVSSGKRAQQRQGGVVMIVALILLVVISLLAVTSMRSATSAEAVAGNVRTTELATQAAEIALRHCESSAVRITLLVANPANTSAEATYATTMTNDNILRATTSVQWQSTATWDSTSTATFVLPSALVGGTATYKRPPECMVESLTGTTTVGTNAAYVVTARGFGPEVPVADNNRTRPIGTEIWLQSTIEIQ
jgi:type IV pilus assembly protein PilX